MAGEQVDIDKVHGQPCQLQSTGRVGSTMESWLYKDREEKMTKTSLKKQEKHVKETFHRHLLLTLFFWCILCASKTVDLLSKLKSGYHAEGLAK